MEDKEVFTKEELESILQKESDRRVTQALSTAQEKWKLEHEQTLAIERERIAKEIEEKSKLTAEELARKELEEKMSIIGQREAELNFKANMLTAKEKLTMAGVPKEQYEKMIDVLVTDNTDKTVSNIDQFINVFNETKTTLETAIRTEMSNVPKPKVNTPQGTTKDDFNKMTFAQKVEFKNTNPELYKKFISE